MIKRVINKAKLILFRRKWRKLNKHNFTTCVNIFPNNIVSVGKYTYGSLHIYVWNENKEGLSIGSYCSIANDVKFILGGNHLYNTISTYPFKVKIHKTNKVEAISKGPIIIEDDVWIGMNAIILSGVRIGKGAVIAAGSIVTSDIEPYAIVGGNPAKIIKKRFADNIIEELLKIDFTDIDFENIQIDVLYNTIESIKQIQDFRKSIKLGI